MVNTASSTVILESIPEEHRARTAELIATTEQKVALARIYEVTSPDQFEENHQMILEAKDRLTLLETLKEKIYRPAKETVDAIQQVFNPPIQACKEEIRLMSEAMDKYRREQARLARAEEERLRLEQAAALQAEEKRLQAEAEKAEKNGDLILADELRNQPATAPPMAAPAVEPLDRKGTVVRKKIVAEVKNLDLLWKWAIETRQHRAIFKYDQKALDAIAQNSDGQSHIPGVIFIDKSTFSVRKQKS